ncbi:MAG TPA: polyphosphate kinase 1 [Thermoanaerobaculaceae bacterium]|nr:polyphosphate kinase 1 [Thermoanaerobaculaceae bacterium]
MTVNRLSSRHRAAPSRVRSGRSRVATEIQALGADAFFNRELSWLAFARRVLAHVGDPAVPLLERVKFAGIMGMLHDEFFMKRIGGLKRQISQKLDKRSLDGRTPLEEFKACRAEILHQIAELALLVNGEVRPALAAAGVPIVEYAELGKKARAQLSATFARTVLPILTPLAVDAEHPFPFISNLGLNLAVKVALRRGERFVRIKVPANRGRWVAVEGGGFVPLEQVIAANIGQILPEQQIVGVWLFRVTRGIEGDPGRGERTDDADQSTAPGSIISQVADELKARRFAGVVRLEVSPEMPRALRTWLAQQLGVETDDVYAPEHFLGLADLLSLKVEARTDLRDRPHVPATHPRLAPLRKSGAEEFFAEIRRGDILLHHPYHSFDTSVLRFLQLAAADPKVLAIKLTIYRTSSDSPIVRALADAARAGKQVAVLVEITARLDEAPNIAWGKLLEREGAHVAYGVERLKTHVKLALVVREEADGIRTYVHVGTGNYHTGTAKLYEDLGILSCEPKLAADVAAVFNELTGSTPPRRFGRLIVAPAFMRDTFAALIRREARHASAGRPSGIRAKMNQLQDPALIRELYAASRAGVPITLNIRGLCCLRPGVAGISDTIRVYSVLGRFLEHARVWAFANGGAPEYYIGSADWMKRNLDNRVETVTPVVDAVLRSELCTILDVYESDNASAWDLQPDGTYVLRTPAAGEPRRPAQEAFVQLAQGRQSAAGRVLEEERGA